eukprot:scaffold535092_cov45-Prasinocladus_malaysianus.AAC.1
MDGWTEGQADERISGWMCGCIHEYLNGCPKDCCGRGLFHSSASFQVNKSLVLCRIDPETVQMVVVHLAAAALSAGLGWSSAPESPSSPK